MSQTPHDRAWAPAELDAIEDALERLDDGVAPPALPQITDPQAREEIERRLGAYRSLSQLSRAWLSTAEPPSHVLAAVLAEARRTPAAAPTPLPPQRDDAPSSWWTRARGWLLPTTAALGAASVIVVVAATMNRAAKEEAGAAVVAERSPTRTDAAPVSAPSKAEDPRIAMAEPPLAAAEVERGDAISAEPAADEARRKASTSAPADGGIATGAGRRGASSAAPGAAAPERDKPREVVETKKSKGPVAPEPSAPKSPVAPPASKADDAELGAISATERLDRADRARQAGDCRSARRDYERVRDVPDRKLRARALRGLSACAERDGDQVTARKLLDEAQAAERE